MPLICGSQTPPFSPHTILPPTFRSPPWTGEEPTLEEREREGRNLPTLQTDSFLQDLLFLPWCCHPVRSAIPYHTHLCLQPCSHYTTRYSSPSFPPHRKRNLNTLLPTFPRKVPFTLVGVTDRPTPHCLHRFPQTLPCPILPLQLNLTYNVETLSRQVSFCRHHSTTHFVGTTDFSFCYLPMT